MSWPPADSIVTVEDVEAAHERVADVVHRTPLETSATLAGMSGAAGVRLKLENLQRTGSFKIRGAYNAMAQLPPEARERGVSTASAGNHAQGVALAGRLLDIETTVVVPEMTPGAKVQATRGYGAELVVEGTTYEQSYERALELAESAGSTFVHPFNDDDVIAGQGTVGLELAEQTADIDTVLVPIGGGGLIAGIATALEAHDPTISVVGVQPSGAFHAKPALERDEIHELSEVDTVAEGIADARFLEKTFAVVRERVDDVVAVGDEELSVAVALLAERAKTVAEPAGAAPVAAVLTDAVDVTDEQVVAVVSGGNVDLTAHAEHGRLGLMVLGRYVEARLALSDWPNSLATVVETVERGGGTVDVLERERRTASDAPNRTPVSLGIEGSSRGHLRRILDSLGDRDGVSVDSHTLE